MFNIYYVTNIKVKNTYINCFIKKYDAIVRVYIEVGLVWRCWIEAVVYDRIISIVYISRRYPHDFSPAGKILRHGFGVRLYKSKPKLELHRDTNHRCAKVPEKQQNSCNITWFLNNHTSYIKLPLHVHPWSAKWSMLISIEKFFIDFQNNCNRAVW